MKFKSKLLTLTLTGMIFISSAIPAAAADITALNTSQNQIANTAQSNSIEAMSVDVLGPHGQKLSDIGQVLYTEIYNAFSDPSVSAYTIFLDETKYASGISETTFRNIKDSVSLAVFLDHPELFWNHNYNLSVGYKNSYNNIIDINVTALRYNGYSNVSSKISAFNTKCNNIISQMNSNSDVKTDRDKFLWIQNYLIDNLVYPSSNGNDYSNYPIEQYPNYYNAYGAIVNGTAVCQGYAAAFKTLCDRAGVDSAMVIGTKNDGAHSWNYAGLNNKWYLVDVTNNDASSNHYKYFLSANNSEYEADLSCDDLTPQSSYAFKLGDVNQDGLLTANDSSELLSDITSNQIYYYTYSEFIAADVNDDGKLTASDCAYILQKVLDNTFKFPAEQ